MARIGTSGNGGGSSFDVDTILTGSQQDGFPVLCDQFGNVLVGV